MILTVKVCIRMLHVFDFYVTIDTAYCSKCHIQYLDPILDMDYVVRTHTILGPDLGHGLCC